MTDMTYNETAGAWEPLEPNPFAVGSVWYASWGYDQTNVDYLVVTRETEASVWLVPCGSVVFNGRLYPDADHWAGVPSVHRKPRNGLTYLHLDNVRTAFPDGGHGHYDTRAAGEAGH